MCSRFVVWGCVEERLWIWIMLGHVLQSTLHWNTLFGGLATFSTSSHGISYSDHSPSIIYLPLFKTLSSVADTQNQKSRLKDENVIWPILMSGITMLGWSSFAPHGTSRCCNIPRNHDNKMTCWCQQEGISKTCHQEIFCPTRMIFRALCRGDWWGYLWSDQSLCSKYFQCSHSV